MHIDFRSLPGGADLSGVFCNKGVEVRQLELEDDAGTYAAIALCGRVRAHDGACVVLPGPDEIDGEEVAAAFIIDLMLEQGQI